MAEFLTAAWLEDCRAALADLPATPGASARVEHVVTAAPGGEVRLGVAVEDGRVVAMALGAEPEATLAITTTYSDALRLAAGELDLSVAVMRGQAKVAGDMGALLALLPLTRTPAFRAALARLQARTTTG